MSNLLVDSVKIYTSPSFSSLRAVLGGVFLLASITLFAYLSVYKVPIFSADNEISLVIIDHSLSMAVEDMSDAGLQISRLEYSKNHILSSFQKSQSLGIISYAKNPSLLSPFSTTARGLNDILSSILPETEIGGSDLPLALSFAKNLYGEQKLGINIYTDGGSTSTTSIPKIPKNWKITLYGIGSEAGGKIPLGYNAQGERRYKYYSGSEIRVPYEKEKMEILAKEIGATLIENPEIGKQNTSQIFSLIKNNGIYFFATFLLVLGILIHPYGRKKMKA